MRSLRHLPLFWLGLLPLVILLWAWADSRLSATRCNYCRDGENATEIFISGSGVLKSTSAVITEPGHEGEVPRPQQFRSITSPWGNWMRFSDSSWKCPWFPPPSHESHRDIDAGYTTLIANRFIPFWLIIAPYLLLWLALTAWQARRWKRKHRATA